MKSKQDVNSNGIQLTPNSKKLDESLGSMSIKRKSSAVKDDLTSQKTDSTKKKVQPRPAQAVPPSQFVVGMLPQHKDVLDRDTQQSTNQ